jgi:hypothetical protein
VNPTDELVPGCAPYRAQLRSLKPSQALDRRIAESIARETSRRTRSTWAWPAAAAAASITALLGIAFVLRSPDAPMQAASAPSATELPAPRAVDDGTLPVSYWPVEPSVVRVRGRLATQPTERQYWLDVRLASDGSMRIVRVISVQTSEEGNVP